MKKVDTLLKVSKKNNDYGFTKGTLMGKDFYMNNKGSVSVEQNGFIAMRAGEFQPRTFSTLKEAQDFIMQEAPKKFSGFKKKEVDYHAENKSLLEKEGFDSSARKFIYRSIDDYFDENPVFDNGTKEVSIDISGYEVDVKGFYDENGEFQYEIKSATNYKKDMLDLLKSKGIKYDLSNVSNSIYFTYKGETYRISDHNRPMQDDFYDPTQQINHNIVVKNNKERYDKLEKILRR